MDSQKIAEILLEFRAIRNAKAKKLTTGEWYYYGYDMSEKKQVSGHISEEELRSFAFILDADEGEEKEPIVEPLMPATGDEDVGIAEAREESDPIVEETLEEIEPETQYIARRRRRKREEESESISEIE